MSNLKNLREQRTAAYKEMAAAVKDKATFEDAQRRFDALNAEIRLEEAKEAVELGETIAAHRAELRGDFSSLSTPRPPRPVLGEMMRALYNAPNGPNPEYRDFTLSGTTATIQNPDIQNQFFLSLKAANPLERLGARFYNGNNFAQFPVETTAPAVVWFAEGDSLTADATAVIGSRKVEYKTCAMLLKASNFWLEDSGPLGAEIITAMAVDAINEGIIKTVLSGASGSKQPVGLDNLTGSGVQTVANGSSTLAGYGKMNEAVKKLLAVNVPLEKIGYMYSPTAWQQMNDLADLSNQPLMMPGGLKDLPGFVSSAVLETYDTNTTTRMYFGDWSNLLVATAGGPRIQILRERYADDLETGFVVYLRLDHQFIRRDNFCILTGIELA